MRDVMLSETKPSSGTIVRGIVKWYDAVKGYGFVVPDGGGADIMVHASCVRAFGRTALTEGSRIRILAVRGQRGLSAQEVLEIQDAEPVPVPDVHPDSLRPTEYLATGAEVGPLMPARVKWFDRQKGFGFVNVFGIADDVFVHMETVRRCGFQDLVSGEGMAVRTFQGPRGLMVAELKLWESALQDKDDGGRG